MQVTQPNEYYKGLPKEDVFFVKDDQNNPVGEGFLIYQYQPTIFPSRIASQIWLAGEESRVANSATPLATLPSKKAPKS